MFDGGLALIRQPDTDESRWLLLWDQPSNQLRFITAARLESESFREAVDREVAWSLQLRRSKDYLVSSVPRLHFESENDSGGVEHAPQCIVEFYLVELFGRQGRETLSGDNRIYWANREELDLGRIADGRSIDPRWQSIVRRADVIPFS